MKPKEIVEKRLGISPDYQYKAMRKSFWLKRNWHKNKFDVIKEVCGFKRKMDVLDLGTGSGNFELLYSRSVKHIYGIDYNDEALLFLKNKLKSRNINNVTLECSDMRKLSAKLASKKYDLIVSIDTIEHITSKDGELVVSWAKKRLSKEGKLVIITPNYQSIWRFLEPVLDILSFTPNMGRHQHLSKYSVNSMTAMLKKTGFKINSATSFNLFSFIFPQKVSTYLLKLELRFLKGFGPLMAIEAVRK